MSYFLKLGHDVEIELPSGLELQERIKFCEEVIDKYPDQFRYVLPKNSKDANIFGNHVSMRLEIMGSYILDAAPKDKEYPVLTEYKEKRIKTNEISMTELENH